MRLALFSDVHGNPIALDAVLADIEQRGGADGYWVLGDLVAIGYDPASVLSRLTSLPNVRFVQGNTDRYVVTGQRPYPSFADAQSDPRLLARLVEVAHSFAWTHGFISATGWFDWLAALPAELQKLLPDGTRMLGVHVAPGKDDGTGIHPALSDDDLRRLLEAASADLVCVGHTHRPLDRTVNGVRAINVGSVSNPLVDDRRASYVILDATESGYTIEHRRVAYDYAAVIEAVTRLRHPAGEYIIRHFAA
jgi:predicted phosphodiesterase